MRALHVICPAAVLLLAAGVLSAQTDPTIVSWKRNTTGAKGFSADSSLNAYMSTFDADVLQVWYNATHVYVKAESIPSHAVELWANRDVYPTEQNNTWAFVRTPTSTEAGTHNELPGSVGVFVNGVQLFSWSDATSYENEDVWHYVAPVVRTDIDSAAGHPAPAGGPPTVPTSDVVVSAEAHTHSWTDDPNHTHVTSDDVRRGTVLTAAGAYHYHTQSPALRAQLGDDGSAHSPILGWAFDGQPIYGPYGYANANGTGGVKLMESSYEQRSISTRTTLPDGSMLAANLHGPNVGMANPLGTFAEDYIYSPGSGDLDEFNGRFSVTPEYPAGVYAYFATMDSGGNSTFPYTVGPDSFYGTSGPFNPNATIPGNAVQYTGVTSSVPYWEMYQR